MLVQLYGNELFLYKQNRFKFGMLLEEEISRLFYNYKYKKI